MTPVHGASAGPERPLESADPAVPAVVLSGVWKRLGGTDVVRDLSFEVRPGELLGFLGPNGAGKTTTMRMILDIIRPDRGRIEVFGGPPGIEHQSRIGYLPEERGLYRDVLTVETLAYLGALRGLPLRDARSRAVRLLREVGLESALGKKAGELSRGMHQKAQLVATILHEPDLLIIDEPFQGLDPMNAQMLRQIVLAERARGAALIMSTHDMAEAEQLCDRILLIDRGRRLLYGTVQEIQRSFSEGAVIVRGPSIPTDAGRLPSVSAVRATDGEVRFLLADDASPRQLFQQLAAAEVAVDHFEVDTPSLDEIFIRAVETDRQSGAD